MLGIVLTPYGTVPNAYPWEINRTMPGTGPFLPPYDPFYNTRGEVGRYHDTYLGNARGLGAIPTDAELGPNMCYTPVGSAWVKTREGQYLAPSWVPPNGWNPAGEFGPPTSLNGLGSALGDIELQLQEHHKRMFLLSAMSTFAAVASSALVFYRTAKLIKHDEDDFKKRGSLPARALSGARGRRRKRSRK